MSGRNLWMPIAALGCLVFLILNYDRDAAEDAQYRPEGYERRASQMLRSHYAYDAKLERIVRKRDAVFSAEDERFLAGSYLLDDIQRFNSGEKKYIRVRRVEGGRYAIDGVEPGLHNQRLSGQDTTTWRGGLTLRGSPVNRLRDDELFLEIMQPTWDDLPHMLARRLNVDLAAADQRRAVAMRLLGPGRQSIAEIKPLGAQTFLELENRGEAQGHVRLNGRALPIGWEGFLRHGDRLEVSGATPRDLRFEAGGEREVASLAALVNGQIVRHEVMRDPQLPLQVSRAISSAIASLGRTGTPLDEVTRATDVQLTFDLYMWRTLQGRMNRRLVETFSDRPLRAGVSVVEAASGRVLALPSYPTPGLLERDQVRPKLPEHQPLLTRNHNLARKVVGSTAKPFLATAALATRPALARLEVRCHSETFDSDRLYGMDFDGTMRLPGIGAQGCRDDRLDFDGFMARSSNLYMLSMGLLALAEWNGRGPATAGAIDSPFADDRFWIDGRAYASRPRMPAARWDDDRLNDLENEPFFDNLSRLFDVETHYRAGESLEAYFDIGPRGAGSRGSWDLLFDGFLPDVPEVAREFSTVASERVNLQANLFQHPRRDLYTFFLGQGENRWSNLHLAEATARLLTGRRTKARFVEWLQRPGRHDAETTLLTERVETESADDEVLQRWAPRVVRAMRETARSGTAAVLGQTVRGVNRRVADRCNCRYDVVAKTGTPQQTLSDMQAGPTAPDPQARVGERDLVRSSVVILGLSRTPGLEQRESLAVAVWIEGQQRGPGEGGLSAVELAAELIEPLARTYWPEDFPGDGE